MAAPRRNIEHVEPPTSGGGATFQSSKQQLQADTHSLPAFEPEGLIDLIDNITSEDSTRPFTYIASSDNPRDGWKPVSFLQVTNGVNYLAHAISEKVKDSAEQFPTVAYIGPNDIRYPMILLACVRAGCKALFISPRNTTAVQLSLFEATNCEFLYCAESFRSDMQPCMEQRKMDLTTIDSIEHLLNVTSAPFPYNKSAEETQWDPLVVLHTSGSTGTPKPIVVRQGSLHAFQKMLHMPKFHDSNFTFTEWANQANKLLVVMPMFHAAGAIMMLMPIFINICTVMAISTKPLSINTALECLEYAEPDAAVLPPSIIEGLSASEQGTQALKKLSFVTFGGGNLSPVAGNALVERGATLFNIIGSTEHFPYAIFTPKDPKLWQYFVFDSKAMGIDWRPRGSDGYELVIRRKDPEDPDIQSCFYTFPELSEWSTKDIYQPHPTLEDHWIYKGRADDVIVFSNGEKLNPVTIEATVSGHPLVQGAIVVGQERFQAALILEPTEEATPKNEDEAKAFINDVWPLIEKANSETVSHGRITKNLVTLSDPAMPFLRAGKGTVQRASTVKLYSDFIEVLYEKAEADGSADVSITLDLESDGTLTESIINVFKNELGVKSLGPDTDFFSAGVDSLKVATVTNLLRSVLKKEGIDTTTIAPRVIYSHPTPKALATYILSIKGGEPDQNDDSKQILEAQRLAWKYTENMPKSRADKQQTLDNDQTVVITGTTGSLGAYMLHQLCQLPAVKKVIALNRDKDGGFSRQHSVNDSRGLTQDFSKVEFLYADLSLPDMGLGKDKYDSLLESVDRVVHNAWPVNFNISVSSFESSIRGVRHLVDFSAAASKHVPIIFVSSIGTVGNWKSSDRVPEVALNDWTLPQMGYGLSKLAGSLILDAAAEKSNVPTASVRVGQIAGSRGEKGIWNPQEFLPSLIASSVYLGALPDHLGAQQEIAWTPVEDIAGLILDVAGITTQKSLTEISGYFHGVNPSIADWAHIAPAVKDFYGDGMSIVSLDEWIKRLEASEKESDLPMEKNPAVKLLDTYRGMLMAKEQGLTMRFSMERTKNQSPTIREAGPITPALMVNWCRQWAY
ncbi:hypothetical protein KAF25_007657 [Fusarium avenaceum]|uniref:Carrier domain-containing protein n=1 Tax=Fusarium avenaceum TaxID=40199 RepID=A0A9P7GVH2_9HYPO|nr:hypothetical protein KAF25_007657 [Fusarium avenaceum]